MKKVNLLCVAICFTYVLFSQVKVISNGNVGMGVSTPSEKLAINGNLRFEATDPIVYFASGNVTFRNLTSTNQILFQTGTTTRFAIVGSSYLSSNLAHRFLDGSASAPGIVGSGTGKTTSGLFWPATNTLSFATGGTERMRIDANGNVGIGITRPSANLQVNNKIYVSGTNTIRIMSSNPGVEFGSSNDVVSFWYSGLDYNIVNAEDFIEISDISLKSDIESIDNSVELLLNIEGKKYSLSTDQEGGMRNDYGFIAQEIQEVVPELVFPLKDSLLGISYTGLIPILVEAFKTQQTQIQYLQSVVYSQEVEIVNLTSTVNNCCGSIIDKSSGVNDAKTESAILYQNVPNPFNETTLIKYSVPSSSTKPRIIIHSLNGEEIKSYSISSSGSGEIVIDAAELNPGMYLYTLIVDNTIIDTKRMILTQ